MGGNTPRFLNRDLSTLSFNLRVSDEAAKSSNKFGERVLFHGITFSNLDEFLQVRYPAVVELSTDSEIQEVATAVRKHYQTLSSRFIKFNKDRRIIKRVENLGKSARRWADKYFNQNVFPALLPITVDRARQANVRAGLYLLVVTDSDDEESVGYVEIPDCLDRFIQVPGKPYVIAIEDLVQSHIRDIIRGRKILRVCPFTILRSAEVYIQPDRYLDPYELIQETLHEREKSWITKLEIGSRNKGIVKTLRKLVPIDENTIVFTSDLIRLSDLKKIPSEIYRDNEKPRKQKIYQTFPDTGIFDYIKKEDRICFHPYESYDGSVVRFIEEAANDPAVASIRISLYRVSDHSRIIDALLKAADSGKLVVVLVELKARFDEKHNMLLSTIMKEGGIRIVYTKPDIKTHAKLCLVTRMEKRGLRVYSHIGTGNYSESNSKLYTDYSYFTADQQIGHELTKFFNLLTADQDNFKSRHIIYAPYNLKSTIVDEINHQMKLAKDKKSGKIVIKCNALTDEGIAERLVEAAKAGVRITLIIRSACIIRPMKNIQIFSVVGQQLEHSRIVVFGTGKHRKVYIGSSDMMTRNLSRRNELMILVEQKNLKARILNHLEMYLKDTVNRRMIQDQYQYTDMRPKKGERPYDCQEAFRREAKKLVIEK